MSAQGTALSMNIVLNSAIRGSQFLQASTKGIHTYSAKLEKIKLLRATNFPVLNRQLKSLSGSLQKIQARTAKIGRKPLNMMGVKEANLALKEQLSASKALERSAKQTAFYSRKDAQNRAHAAKATLAESRAARSTRHRRLPDGSVSSVLGAGMIAAPFFYPLKKSFDFEESITSVIAKTDPRYAKDLPLLRQTALNLGGSTEWTMGQVAKGEEYLTMAGFNPRQIAQAMRGNLALATVGGLDLGTSADISSNILTGYGKKAGEMDRVADVMTKTITTSNTNIEEMGEAQKYVATVARGLRGKKAFLETTALIGMLANAGIKGSIAGTHLKGMYMRVSAPTKKSREAQAALGFSAYDDTGHAKSIAQMLGEMKTKFKEKHYTQQQQVQTMKDIFGMIALPSAMALMQQGKDKILSYQHRIDQSQGEALRIQQMKLDTPIGQLKLLSSAFSGLGLAMTSQLITPFKSLVSWVTKGVNSLQRWAMRNKNLAATIYGVGVVAGTAGVALAAFGLVASLAGKGLRILGIGGKKSCSSIGCISGNAATAGEALKGLGGTVTKTRGLFASPLMLTVGIAGVAAVLAGLHKIAQASNQAIRDKRSITPTANNLQPLEEKESRLEARLKAAKGESGIWSRIGESFVHGSNSPAKIRQLEKELERTRRNRLIAETGSYKPPQPVNDPSYTPEQLRKAKAYSERMHALHPGTPKQQPIQHPTGYVKPISSVNNVLPVQSPTAVAQATAQAAQTTINNNTQNTTHVTNNIHVVAKSSDPQGIAREIGAEMRRKEYNNKAAQLKDVG